MSLASTPNCSIPLVVVGRFELTHARTYEILRVTRHLPRLPRGARGLRIHPSLVGFRWIIDSQRSRYIPIPPTASSNLRLPFFKSKPSRLLWLRKGAAKPLNCTTHTPTRLALRASSWADSLRSAIRTLSVFDWKSLLLFSVSTVS